LNRKTNPKKRPRTRKPGINLTPQSTKNVKILARFLLF